MFDRLGLTAITPGAFSNGCESITNSVNIGFSGNQLTVLRTRTFVGLTKVQNLDFQSNPLTTLEPYVFDGMTTLVGLNFAGSQLSLVANYSFGGTPNLQSLTLGNNRLATIPLLMFAGAPALSNLYEFLHYHADTTLLTLHTASYLDNNPYTDLPDGLFAGMSSLTFLMMSYNGIEHIRTNMWKGLKNVQLFWLMRTNLRELPSKGLKPFSNLQTFFLGGNTRLSYVARDAFDGLSTVQQLFMGTTDISGFHRDTFTYTPNLRFLDFGDNRKITLLPRDLFSTNTLLSTLSVGNLPTGTACTSLGGQELVLPAATGPMCVMTDALGEFDFAGGVAFTCLPSNDRIRIPPNTFASVSLLRAAACNNLVEVTLTNERIALMDPTFPTNLTSVTSLSLTSNALVSVPSSIGTFMRSLERLDLSHNALIALPSIASPTLQFLDLSYNSIVISSSVAIQPWLAGLPRLGTLLLVKNKITLMPPGFGILSAKIATIALANNLFARACTLVNALDQRAPGSADAYCEAKTVAVVKRSQHNGGDLLTVTLSPASAQLLESTYSYRIGSGPYASGNFTNGTISFPAGFWRPEDDGQLVQVQVFPLSDLGAVQFASISWRLSFAPPVALFAKPVPAIIASSQLVGTLQCNKPACTFLVYVDGQLDSTIIQANEDVVAFSGDAVTFASTTRLWSTTSGTIVLDQDPVHVSVDGGPVFMSAAFTAPVTNLADGAHTLVAWTTDARGVRQPCPLGIAWRVSTHPPSPPTPLVLQTARWVAFNASDTASMWQVCGAGVCKLYALNAVRLPDSAVFVFRAVDALLRVSTDQTLAVVSAPRATLDVAFQAEIVAAHPIWDTAPFHTLPLQGVADVRVLPTSMSWQADVLSVPKVNTLGSHLVQVRVSGGLTTMVAWRTEACAAQLQLLPRVLTCQAAPGVYCADEYVYGVMAANCSVPLELSLDDSATWAPASSGVLVLSEPRRAGSSTATLRWADGSHRVAATAAWTRSALSAAFPLSLAFTCLPSTTQWQVVDTLCVISTGFFSPGSTIQWMVDSSAWTNMQTPSINLLNLSPGVHTVLVRVVTGRDSSLAVLSTAHHTWLKPAPVATAVLLRWKAKPHVISWENVDVLSWGVAIGAAARYQYSFDSGWVTTTSTQVSIPSDWQSNLPAYRCLTVRAVLPDGTVSDNMLEHCWWNIPAYMDLVIAASNGRSQHTVFNQSAPVQVVWSPSNDDQNGVRAIKYAALPGKARSCSPSQVSTWVRSEDFMVNETLAEGWYTLFVRGTGYTPHDGPLVCHSLFVSGSPPTVTLLEHPSATSSAAEPVFMFEPSTPVYGNDWWFECQYAQLEAACPGAQAATAWKSCISPLRLGPLPPAPHALNIRVRTSGGVGVPVYFSWTVISSTTSPFTVVALSDGPHELTVKPIDEQQRMGETLAATVFVDTARPILSNVLLQPQLGCIFGRCYMTAAVATVTFDTTDLPRAVPCDDCVAAITVQQCSVDTVCVAYSNSNVTILSAEEGNYGVSVAVKDPAGNMAQAVHVQFVVDHTPPATTLSLKQAAIVWRGTLVVTAGEATWELAFDDAVTTHLRFNGTSVWRGDSCDILGQCMQRQLVTTPLGDVADGLLVVTACSVDGAGNAEQAPCGSALLTLDRVPPVTAVSLATPIAAGATNVSSVGLILGGYDVTTAIATWHIRHYFNDSIVVSDIYHPHPRWTSGQLADGPHRIVVAAVDVGGNEAPPVRIGWVVDRTPPRVVATVRGGTAIAVTTATLDLIAVDDSQHLQWAVHHSGPAGTLQPIQTASRTRAVLTLTNLAHGIHALSVQCQDAAGNIDTDNVQVQLVVDLLPPSTTVQLSVPTPTNASEAVVLLTASDSLTPIAGWRLHVVYPNATVTQLDVHPVVQSSSATAQLRLRLSDEGTYSIAATAVDMVGNRDPVGQSLVLRVDHTLPSIRFSTYPAPLTNSSTVSMTVHCSEPAKLRVSFNAGTEWQSAACGVLISRFVADGTLYPLATAVDDAGNTVPQVLAGAPITVDTTALRAMQLQFVGSNAADTVLKTNKNAVQLQFAMEDANSRPCDQCTLIIRRDSVDGSALGSARGTTGTLRVPTLSDGAWQLVPIGIDAAGNVRVGTILLVYRDATPPRSSMVQASAMNETFTNSTSFRMAVSSDKPLGGRFHIQGAVQRVCTEQPCSIALSGLADGEHCLSIRSQDEYGNLEVAALVWCWTVDTVAPVSTWAQAPPALVASTTISGTIVFQPHVRTIMTVIAGSSSAKTVCQRSQCNMAVPFDGQWDVTVQSTDEAGNEELGALRVSVVVDSQPPVVSWNASAVPAHITQSDAWHLQASFSDMSAVQVVAKLRRADGVEQLTSLVWQSATAFSVFSQALPEGLWTLNTRVVDAAGHGSPLQSWTWLVDYTAPRISTFQPATPALLDGTVPVYTSTAVLWSVTCADALTGCTLQTRWVQTQSFAAKGCVGTGASQVLPQSTFASLQPTLVLPSEGMFEVFLLATDGAGNRYSPTPGWAVAIDTSAPAAPIIEVTGIQANSQTKQPVAQITVTLKDDPSPAQDAVQLQYRFQASGDWQAFANVTRTRSATGVIQQASLLKSGLTDGDYALSARAVDGAGHAGAVAQFVWSVQTAAPETRILNAPPSQADVGVGVVWRFALEAVKIGPARIAKILIQTDSDETWQPGCTGSDGCELFLTMSKAGIHTLKAVAVNELGTADDSPAQVSWNVKQCGSGEVANINSQTGLVVCDPCPPGGDCMGGTARVEAIVAKQGYWASTQGNTFYKCPLAAACTGGSSVGTASNASITRATCAEGYTGVLCSMCAEGYFLQFGECSACPANAAEAWVAVIGLCLLFVAVAAVGAAFKHLLPQTVLKIGLAMVQIVGSVNNTFSAPWPSSFVSLLAGLKVFMLELLTLTRTSCAVPLSFYTTYAFTVFGMTLVSGLLVLGLLAWQRAVSNTKTKRPLLTVVAKPLFMFWLFCYPAVSLKLFQVFKCMEVEGVRLLMQDMRITCDDSTWAAYAAISVLYIIAFTAGLPIAIAWVLYRQRTQLSSATMTAELGFLYQQYGQQAFAWEPVELLRKLLLTSALTLLDVSTALPLTLAVLISAFAHVLHALYKPFVERRYYLLQHASLTVTTIVFTIGLMFKVQGGGADGFSVFMTLILFATCIGLLLAFVVVGGYDVMQAIKLHKSTGGPKGFIPRLSAKLTGTTMAPQQMLGVMENPLHLQRKKQARSGVQPGIATQ